MIVAGIMSGTSLDGIDVAIVDINGRSFSVMESWTVPYPARVRQAILSASSAAGIARLHFFLGELYADAVKRGKRRPELIACHGQTIHHEGDAARFLGRRIASTLQIGASSVIAERTGIPVVSDFRPRDIAAGGRGAPLVPFVDYLLFRHPRRSRVALNIGGIANVTIIPAGAQPDQVVAFDTGPGNMIIDALAELHSNGKRSFDKNGKLAARGVIDIALLRKLLAAPYYRRKPPKTAGREQFGRAFIDRLLSTGRSLADLIATTTLLTASSIALGIRRFAPAEVDEVIVSGGGVRNPIIMRHLAALLPGVAVASSSDFGIDVDAKEAIAFAILGYQTWRGRPSNLPSATGAQRPVILGSITPAPPAPAKRSRRGFLPQGRQRESAPLAGRRSSRTIRPGNEDRD